MNNDPLVSIETEATVLGALILSEAAFSEWADRIKPTDFVEPVHQRIYTKMLQLVAQGKKVSPQTIKPLFRFDLHTDNGELIDKITETPAAIAVLPPLAALLIDYASRRAAREGLSTAAAALETDFDRSMAEIAGGAQDAAWAAQAREEIIPTRDAAEMISIVRQRAEEIDKGDMEPGAEAKLVPEWNDAIGPLQPGWYVILAGRPGMGKTAAASSVSLGYALNGHPVLFIYREQEESQMAMRFLSDLSFALGYDIKLADIIANKLTPEQRGDLVTLEEKAARLPIRFREAKEGGIRTVHSLIAREKAMWAAQGRKLRLAVVDYLGLFEPEEDDRKRAMRAISSQIRRTSKELQVPIMALAQLSRAVEGRTNKRPVMSDLREAGDLEQDADVVAFVYREIEYHRLLEPPDDGTKAKNADLTDYQIWYERKAVLQNQIEFVIGKHRFGEPGIKTASFHGSYVAVRERNYNLDAEVRQEDMFR